MAPVEFEAPHVLLPTAFHTHTIIAVHGRGSQGLEFSEELFEEKTSSGLTLRQTFPGCKWVFPSSKERYSTVFQEELDEWFDIYSLTDPSAREDLQIEGLRVSIDHLQTLLREEVNIVGHERVILLGLSQGSAVETYTGSGDFTEFFGATLGLLPLPIPRGEGSVLDTPVMLGHTTDDEVIDVKLGEQARDVLKMLGMNVLWYEENEGGHLGLLKTKGLDRIAAFLEEVGSCVATKETAEGHPR